MEYFLKSVEYVLCMLIWCDMRVVSGQHGFYPTRTTQRCFSVAGIPRLDLNRCDPGEMILIQVVRFFNLLFCVCLCVYR